MSLTTTEKFWKKIAGADRAKLVEIIAESERTKDEYVKRIAELQALNARRDSVIIAYSNLEASLSMNRLGLTPKGRTVVLTNSTYSSERLRGRKLWPEEVLLVPGWARGKYADDVRRSIQPAGVRLDQVRYAPSPETDRADGPSNWGRLELGIVEDLTRTLGGLLDRTLEASEAS